MPRRIQQQRPWRRRVAAALMTLGIVLLGLSSIVTAQSAPTGDPVVAQAGDSTDQIRIIEVSGLIDPVVTDFLLRELDAAEADGVLAVVLQVDSAGAVIDNESFVELATRLRDVETQVVAWVGPSGARALGGTAELVGVADLIGVSAGSRLGESGDARLAVDEFPPAFGDATTRLETTSISAGEAVELGISPGATGDEGTIERSVETNSVLRQFVTQIEGYNAPVTEDDDASLLTQAQFRQLPLTGQLFHTAASPEVAYLFFVGGLSLLIFELFTAGVGVAGVIGVGLLVAGSYGIAVLPTRTWAIVVLMLAFLAMAIDIQTNVPRFYSAVGVGLFVIGTWFLYDGVTMSWITGLFGIVGAVLYAYTGMPSMVRTRFSTPTIGRKWMIGTMGAALTDLSPEGTVEVEAAQWRAITNRATPVKAGDRVRVVGIDRLLLEVEPEEGGAKDYRERG